MKFGTDVKQSHDLKYMYRHKISQGHHVGAHFHENVTKNEEILHTLKESNF